MLRRRLLLERINVLLMLLHLLLVVSEARLDLLLLCETRLDL